MAKLSRPRKYDVSFLQDWLARPEGGDNFLGPDEDRPWLVDEGGDLVAVSASRYDSLTHWIEEALLPWAFSLWSPSQTTLHGPRAIRPRRVEERLFWAIAKAVSVVMSTVIPSLAVLVLFLIKTFDTGYWRRSF